MLFYLKESFFAKSTEFSTLIYERFFRILSKAKNMLCDDDGFTLCVMAFMMMEASHLKEIDAQIQEIKQENTTNIIPRITPSPIIPHLEKKTEKNAYEILLDSIYDRDFDLAECFKQSTNFISFENNTLNINSNAQGQNRDTLNKGFKLIQELFKAKFGKMLKLMCKKY